MTDSNTHGGGPLPPGVPPQPPVPAPREARGVAFFVALFLGILLVASAGLNVLLLLLSLGSLAGGGLSATGDGHFDEVHVGGVRSATARVLRIPIHGAITQASNPLLGSSGGMVTRVERQLREAAADDSIHGVLLDIDEVLFPHRPIGIPRIKMRIIFLSLSILEKLHLFSMREINPYEKRYIKT